jgi:hypothetical protein
MINKIQKLIKKEEFFIPLFFSLLVIFLTWPLIINLDQFYKFSEDSYDTPQFVFRIYYYKNFMKNGVFPLTITKYYYPDGVSPITETIIPTYSFLGGLIGILTNLNEIVIHNLISIFFIILSCISLYYFIKEITKNKTASIIGSLTLLSSNIILGEMYIGHPDNIQIFWVILVFLFIEKIIKNPKIKYGIILGLTLTMTFLSSLEYFLYLNFIVPLYFIFRDTRVFSNRKFLKTILIAFLVFVLTSSWYMQYFIGKNYEKRAIEENMKFSLDVYNIKFIVSPLFLLTAFCGLLISLKQKNKIIIPFLVIGMFSLIYSFGPFSKISLQYLFLKYWPFVDAFRTPYRIQIFFVIFISIASSIFVEEIYKKYKYLTYTLIILCILVIYFSNIYKSRSFYEYSVEEISFYKDISKILGNFSIVEYPNTRNCWYVYNIIFHSKNLIGGCAAYEPSSYVSFSQNCGELFNISENCLNEIKKLNLKYAIYHSNNYQNWRDIYQSLQKSKFLILEKNYDDLYRFKINQSSLEKRGS